MVSLAKLREMLTLSKVALVAALLVGSTVAVASGTGGIATGSAVNADKPEGQCVKETSYMRKNHMDELKHQRDDTMRKGIRTKDLSLQNCINCHASKKTNSVLGSDGFCQKCHTQAAVKLDCFECHSGKPKSTTPYHRVKGDSTGKTSALADKMRSEIQPATIVEPVAEAAK
jgi:hypothetical protein